MTFRWNYPVFLVPLGQGYVSVRDPDVDNPQFLAVFTATDAARDFMQRCELPGQPRALDNAREFAWLLQSLQAPVTEVAFDPQSAQGKVNAQWLVSVEDLLTEHLQVDYSPWNYPVFVIRTTDGFAAITGQSSSGNPTQAICLFTDRDKAENFTDQIEERGELLELENLRQARGLLEQLSDATSAVAVNAVAEGERRSAEHCFSLRTILDKYLVTSSPGEQP